MAVAFVTAFRCAVCANHDESLQPVLMLGLPWERIGSSWYVHVLMLAF